MLDILKKVFKPEETSPEENPKGMAKIIDVNPTPKIEIKRQQL